MARSGLCCPEICSEGIMVEQNNFSFLQQNTGSATWLSFSVAFGFEFMHFVFVVFNILLSIYEKGGFAS